MVGSLFMKNVVVGLSPISVNKNCLVLTTKFPELQVPLKNKQVDLEHFILYKENYDEQNKFLKNICINEVLLEKLKQ